MTQLEQAMANVDQEMKELIQTERPKIMTARPTELVAERDKTHGEFNDHAMITQLIKAVMQAQPNWAGLSYAQKESLEMIAHKIGRILAGNPDFKDHWDDIAGYAVLISQRVPS